MSRDAFVTGFQSCSLPIFLHSYKSSCSSFRRINHIQCRRQLARGPAGGGDYLRIAQHHAPGAQRMRQLHGPAVRGRHALADRVAVPQRKVAQRAQRRQWRSEEHTSELQSLMRISYAVFCLKEKTTMTVDNRLVRQSANAQEPKPVLLCSHKAKESTTTL